MVVGFRLLDGVGMVFGGGYRIMMVALYIMYR